MRDAQSDPAADEQGGPCLTGIRHSALDENLVIGYGGRGPLSSGSSRAALAWASVRAAGPQEMRAPRQKKARDNVQHTTSAALIDFASPKAR